jgi:hypothetical protein
MPQSVTTYLGYARECASLADKMTGRDKARRMEIAEACLKLADEAAQRARLPPTKVEDARNRTRVAA